MHTLNAMRAPKGDPPHPSQTHNDLTVYDVTLECDTRCHLEQHCMTHWNAWRKFDPRWATTPVRFIYIHIHTQMAIRCEKIGMLCSCAQTPSESNLKRHALIRQQIDENKGKCSKLSRLLLLSFYLLV